MTERRRAMSASAFERIYQPLDAADGGAVFEHSETLAFDPHRVWSLVDGDNGEPYVVPGYHVVNVFGYCVTEKPWTDADADANLHARW